jgi:hypothetical protein
MDGHSPQSVGTLLIADRAVELVGVAAVHQRGCHPIRSYATAGVCKTSSTDMIRTIGGDGPGANVISAI